MPYFKSWNPPEIEHTRAVFSWNVWYAYFVHEGGTRLDGTRFPARPWTDYAISEVDLLEVFKTHFKGDLEAAFKATAEDLDKAFTSAIESPIWKWDRVTIRKNSDVVNSPRDAVDLGNLRDSQELNFL